MQNDLKNVEYWSYHASKRPVIIFIHGFTGSHEGFRYIIPHLRDFHVIVPDLPGFGISPLPTKPWSIERVAKLMNEFVAALKLKEPPYLVSHSMGSLVAASMLAQRPDLYNVKSAFISPVTTKISWNDGRKAGALLTRWQYAFGKNFPKLGPKLVKNKQLSIFATKVIRTTKDKELQKAIDDHHLDNLNYISSIEYYHTLHTDITGRGIVDYADKLESFDILIIVGDKDNVTPLRTIKAVNDRLTFSLETIGGVGHLTHYETPDRIARALRDFLK